MAKQDSQASSPVAEADLRSPMEWRVLTQPDLGMYQAAAYAHGWGEHEHHEGKPLLLSQADFAAAIKATEKLPGGSPHAAAMSPHSRFRATSAPAKPAKE